MRKPLKVQQVVHFFPQHPALPVQLLSPFVLSFTQLCPYPPAPEDAQPQISQHCLLRTNTRNQSSQISKSAVGHSAMTSMGLGSGPSEVPLSLLFIPPIYHLPFQVWPLHAQILLKSSFHPFLLFTFAQNHCPEPPLYFSLVSSFPSLSVQKTTRQRLCTSQTFFPQSGAKGKQQLAIPSHYKDTNSLRICRNQGASCPGKHPLLPAGVWLYVSSTF